MNLTVQSIILSKRNQKVPHFVLSFLTLVSLSTSFLYQNSPANSRWGTGRAALVSVQLGLPALDGSQRGNPFTSGLGNMNCCLAPARASRHEPPTPTRLNYWSAILYQSLTVAVLPAKPCIAANPKCFLYN